MDLKIIADVGVSVFVVSSFMSLFTFIIKKEFTRLNETIASLSKYIGTTNISKEQSSMLFEMVMQLHITKKIKYIKLILEENNIVDRELKIKDNIESIFREITQKEILFLSGFNCCYTKSLHDINWEVFLAEVYSIVWNNSLIPQKLSDLEILMSGYVSNMIEKANVQL